MGCSRHPQSKLPPKPSRPPPPPPLPRRPQSLQHPSLNNSCNSLNQSRSILNCSCNCADSTYSYACSEGPHSVRSVPCSSISLRQPRSHPACSCDSAQSTSELLPIYSPLSVSEYCRSEYTSCHSECYSTGRGCLPALNTSAQHHSHSTTIAGRLRNCQVSSCCETRSQCSDAPPAPVPRERKFIPTRSLSPIPKLKSAAASTASTTTSTNNNNDNNNQYEFNGNQRLHSRTRERCSALNYKRHVEQHIEKLFKYLRERQKRLEECNRIIQNNPYLEETTNFKSLLATKETRHLRSLRTKLTIKDFQILDKLGAGFIGNVSLVKKIGRNDYSTKKPELYAMKKLKKSQVFRQNHMAHVMAERDIMAESDSEWIVKLYYSFQDELYLYFILEYVPGGDMMNLLQHEHVFSEDLARFYIAEISLALQFVHDMKFIHRDIKPDNILIDAKGHIKLADFGLCTGFRWTHDLKYYRDDTTDSAANNHDADYPTITTELSRRDIELSSKKRTLSLVGSPNYIAPEVLRQERTNERLCDWWSVGVILYEMIVGYCPFIDIQQIKLGTYDHSRDPPENIQMRIVNWRKHLTFPSSERDLMRDKDGKIHSISYETKSLISGLLCDPNERLCQRGLEDLKDHLFFKDVDWDNIRRLPSPKVPVLRDEYDTRHFDQCADFPENECTINPYPSDNLSINFTHVAFWKKPMDED